MPTQKFNNVAKDNQATFVPDTALHTAEPGCTYKDAPLGGQIPPSAPHVGPRAQLPTPDSPTRELSQGPTSALNIRMDLGSPVLQALAPSRVMHPERSLSYTPTPDSTPRRYKRTPQPLEHFDTPAVQEAKKQARPIHGNIVGSRLVPACMCLERRCGKCEAVRGGKYQQMQDKWYKGG